MRRNTQSETTRLSSFLVSPNVPPVFPPRADRLASDVAEIQGLYGAFSFPEKLLQKIWLRRDFDTTRAVTTDGRMVAVMHPGKWNLLAGPDFTSARLRIGDGPELTGEVELHLRASDWDAHGHVRDEAYDGVVLHVVLFPPPAGTRTLGKGGREIPILALLPLLLHDLEEYAADEAVEVLANRPAVRLTAELSPLPAPQLGELLRRHAASRWRQKVHFARLRVQKLGWEQACHHSALEVLGFRYNRSPMLRIAGRWSLADWVAGRITVEAVLLEEIEHWSVQGVRPANHPRTRLRQYASWVSTVPDWPERLSREASALVPLSLESSTRDLRRERAFSDIRESLATRLCGGAIGGTRLDNLICDAFLPLLAGAEKQDSQGWWFHWFPGDLPPFVAAGLKQLGVWDGRTQPACHGLAQGLLGWMIEREVRR
jgi:hypothetical protein